MDSIYSIVEFLHGSNSSCGYCKSSNSNYSTGMWAYTMTVQDYQDLIDRGWRRSGQYCYKPDMKSTCCPLYTIRCEALNLKLSKSQKKLLKKVGKYLLEGNISRDNRPGSADSDSGGEMQPMSSEGFDKNISKVMEDKSSQKLEGLMEVDVSADRDNVVNKLEDEPETNTSHQRTTLGLTQEDDALQVSTSSEKSLLCSEEENSSIKKPKPGDGRDFTKPQCKKAKLLRLERKQLKLLEKGLSSPNDPKKGVPTEKSLEDLINEFSTESAVNKLELRLVRSYPRSQEFEATFNLELTLYQKYQMTIHKDPLSKVSEQQFTRFLVTSPLKPQAKIRGSSSSLKTGYGSFHQQYWLNGKLIAVGVIDILPKCVSSVYFFYDPDYSFLSLGTYGSFREMELVRSLHKQSPELCYYYMGYYIHTCPKMRYKARYYPSYLLCPEVYTWHPISDCQSKLDGAKYCRFSNDPEAVCEDSLIVINEVLVLHNHVAMSYATYKMRTLMVTDSDDEEIKEYAELVGKKCAEKMLLLR